MKHLVKRPEDRHEAIKKIRSKTYKRAKKTDPGAVKSFEARVEKERKR